MAAVRRGIKTASQTIEQVANNDASLTSLDLTKNATFCMKVVPNMQALCAGLSKNTFVKTLVLRECEITDPGAEALAKALAENQTIEEIDLQQNRITTYGVVALAEGLAKNRGVRTLNLLNQNQAVLGEQCVQSFIEMFKTNITLTKLMWKVNSRNTWELSKYITRNVEIGRHITAGTDHEHLMPVGLKAGGAPPVAPPAAPPVATDPKPEALPPVAQSPPARPVGSPARFTPEARVAEPVATPTAAAPEPVAESAKEAEEAKPPVAPVPDVAAPPEPEVQGGEAEEAEVEKDEKAQAEEVEKDEKAPADEVETDVTTCGAEKDEEGVEDGAAAAGAVDGTKALGCEAEDTEDVDASVAPTVQ